VITLAPIGFAYTLLKSFVLLDVRIIQDYYFKLAISLDQLGNVVMSGLFNAIIIKSKDNQFGNPDETISSVLGKNLRTNTLTLLGRILNAILNRIDDNHSINAIEEDE
jgi:hypothetical protein